MNAINNMNGKLCSCGKIHDFQGKVCAGAGVLEKLPTFVNELGGTKVFVLSDENTFAAA